MSGYITGQGSAAWAVKETSYGVAPTTPTYNLLNMTGESMSATFNKLDEATLIGTKTLPEQDLGSVTVSGGVSTILKPAFVDWLFDVTLGKCSSVTHAGSNHFDKNTYTLQDVGSAIPTSQMRLQRGTKQFEYSGLTVGSLTLNCTAGDFVKADVDFKGYKEVFNNSTAWTVPASTGAASYKCTKARLVAATAGTATEVGFNWDWDTCPADTVYDIKGATITFDNGLEDTPATYCSGVYANQPINGQRSVTIQCDVPYSASFEAFRQQYYASENPDKIALMLGFCSKETISYTQDSSTVTYPKEQVMVILPNISITSMSANVSGQGLIDGSFNGTALSIGSTEPVIVIVKHGYNS